MHVQPNVSLDKMRRCRSRSSDSYSSDATSLTPSVVVSVWPKRVTTITMRSREHHDRHLGACSLHLAHVGPRPASARRGYSHGLPSAEFTTCSQRSTQRHHISRFATEVARARLAGTESTLERSPGCLYDAILWRHSIVMFRSLQTRDECPRDGSRLARNVFAMRFRHTSQNR